MEGIMEGDDQMRAFLCELGLGKGGNSKSVTRIILPRSVGADLDTQPGLRKEAVTALVLLVGCKKKCARERWWLNSNASTSDHHHTGSAHQAVSPHVWLQTGSLALTIYRPPAFFPHPKQELLWGIRPPLLFVMYSLRRRQLSSLLWRTGLGGVTYYTTQRGVSLGTTANCEPPSGPGKRGYKKTAATLLPNDAPPDKLSLEKALADMKEANKAVGGTLNGDEALAIMALLAREVVQQQTKGTYTTSRHLSPLLVSPPLSALRSRQRAKRFLEYATLCLNVYDLPSDKDWISPPPELGQVNRWELLSSHKGGVCIPRHVVLRVDGGVGTSGRRRTKRLMVVVRGTAEVTDAAINIAMAPGTWGYQGGEYQCHKGIVESAAFLVRMVRPVIWREIEKMKKEEGVDVGSEIEVVFTGHSLGGATAAVAALELQGEFGVRVPVRSVGFSSPASLSEEVAASPLTRKIITTVVLGDDMIPRCSTRNLQELKRRARSVLVEEEVGFISKMLAGEVSRRGDAWSRQIQGEVTRRGDEWTRQLTGMLLSKASEAKQQLPEGWGNLIPPLPVGEGGGGLDVNGLKQAFSGALAHYLPPLTARQQQQWQQQKTDAAGAAAAAASAKEEEERVAASAVVAAETKRMAEEATAVLEQALIDYQAALDAEIVYVKDQIERIKREALDSYLPSSLAPSPPPPSSSGNRKQQRANNSKEEESDQDYDAEEEANEQALLDANAARATERRMKMMDVPAVQAMLQALIVEKANLAASAVKSQAEARGRELLTSSSNKVEEVKDKAAGTVKWVTDSFKGLQEQAKAALPVGGRKGEEEKQGQERQREEKEGVVASAVKEEKKYMVEPATAAAAAAADEGELDAVALYPPGEIFYIHPLPLPDVSSSSSSSSRGREKGEAACNYEMRRVRDVHFFDGIVLSPHMFTNHLLTSTIKGLKELGGEGGRE